MKKILLVVLSLFLFSCTSTKSKMENNILFEVIFNSEYGGEKTENYKIITQIKDFESILNDNELTEKIKSSNFNVSNYILLNLGEKNTGGYSIGIESIKETDKNIIIKVQKISPKPEENVTNAFTNPFCIVKINSKKTIVFE